MMITNYSEYDENDYCFDYETPIHRISDIEDLDFEVNEAEDISKEYWNDDTLLDFSPEDSFDTLNGNDFEQRINDALPKAYEAPEVRVKTGLGMSYISFIIPREYVNIYGDYKFPRQGPVTLKNKELDYLFTISSIGINNTNYSLSSIILFHLRLLQNKYHAFTGAFKDILTNNLNSEMDSVLFITLSNFMKLNCVIIDYFINTKNYNEFPGNKEINKILRKVKKDSLNEQSPRTHFISVTYSQKKSITDEKLLRIQLSFRKEYLEMEDTKFNIMKMLDKNALELILLNSCQISNALKYYITILH